MTKVKSDTKYRLGLDMGMNSIGWAAIRQDENGAPCGILDMGGRIFPDGRNPRDETSNAVQRRVVRRLKRRAERNNRSLESEARHILMLHAVGAHFTSVRNNRYPISTDST